MDLGREVGASLRSSLHGDGIWDRKVYEMVDRELRETREQH